MLIQQLPMKPCYFFKFYDHFANFIKTFQIFKKNLEFFQNVSVKFIQHIGPTRVAYFSQKWSGMVGPISRSKRNFQSAWEKSKETCRTDFVISHANFIKIFYQSLIIFNKLTRIQEAVAKPCEFGLYLTNDLKLLRKFFN